MCFLSMISLKFIFSQKEKGGFNREPSQWSTYFLGKYYFRMYLNVKIPHPKLFQGEYLFPGGSTYLVVNKYGGVVTSR